jgi:hypothetical protein
MIPQVVGYRTFRLAGFDFDVKGTIYSGSEADEVLRGLLRDLFLLISI